MENSFVPEERLRVFISSAQNNENGFAWSDIRRRIKLCLSECPYLNPFIIEDETSSTPSLQFFQRQLRKADLTVLLVKGQVRYGTSVEYALATKLKKPLLVYFLLDALPSPDVANLRKNIESIDYCTYREISNFDNIEFTIRDDVIKDVIRWYQDRPFLSDEKQEETTVIPMLMENSSSKSGIPIKTTISLFSSSYSNLAELLDIGWVNKENCSESSELEILGNDLLNWLVVGSHLQFNEEISKLISKSKIIYDDTRWLEERWKAIQYQMNGNITEALTCERNALELATSCNMPQWIINDILIDCRNAENTCAKADGKMLIEGPAQQELNKLDTIVYLPVLDRYLSNIYDIIAKEKFKIDTASRYTTFFGCNLGRVISEICNYLFSAALYGSYTHLLCARKILIYALNEYAGILNFPTLICRCINLYVLQGDAKQFTLFIKKNWDTVYSTVATEANDIWELTKSVSLVERSTMQQAVLDTLGLYFSDKVFTEAENFIFSEAQNVNWGNSHTYLNCIRKNIPRLNPNQVITVLCKIIVEKRYIRGYDITSIIGGLDLDKVTRDNLIILRNVLNENLSTVIDKGGSPQVIAVLVRYDQELFRMLEENENNGLTGIQKSLYMINKGSDDWKEVLQEELDQAQKHFDEYNKEGVYAAFASDPYAMISYISRNTTTSNAATVCDILSQKFVPLAVEVLNSRVAIPTKESCANVLCDVLSLFLQYGIAFPPSLIDSLKNIDTTQGSDFVQYKSRAMLEIRIFMAKLIVGILGKESLLTWCVEYNKHSLNERVGLAECIEKYLYYHEDERKSVDALILSIVLQCAEDESYEIRIIAYQTLSYLLDRNYKGLVENCMYQAIADPSYFVRNKILSLCQRNVFTNEMVIGLAKALAKDSNYAVRTRSLLMLDDMEQSPS